MTTPAWKGEPLRVTMSGIPFIVWMRSAGAPPVMLYNFDQNNTIYAGYTSNIQIGAPNTQILPPNFGLTMDGTRAIYVVGPKGAGPLQITPGGGAPFQLAAINIVPQPSNPPAEDASTPAVVQVVATTNPSGTTAAFSPPAGSWLYAIFAVDYAGTFTAQPAISDSGGHTWTQVVNLDDGLGHCVGIYSTHLVTAPGSITVTASDTTGGNTSSGIDLAVRVVINANANQSGAGKASTSGNTDPKGNITTTKSGSLVYICAGTSTSPATAISGTTQIDQFNDDKVDLLGKSSANTQVPGSTTFGWTTGGSGQMAWCAAEVIP